MQFINQGATFQGATKQGAILPYFFAPQVAQLKIDHNPFAKGFRDTGAAKGAKRTFNQELSKNVIFKNQVRCMFPLGGGGCKPKIQ